jgi:predicted metal-dependent peptidase
MSEDNKKSIEDIIKEVKKQQEEFNKLDHGQILRDYHSALQKCMFYFGEDQQFLGPMVQELNYRANYALPTAGIHFNKDQGYFTVEINPLFFLKLSEEERVAVMHHESLHFINNHLLRFPWVKETPKQQRQLENIAMDMAINQYIKNIPKGGVKVEDWKLDNGKPFPKFKTAEEYVKLIKENKQKNKETEKKYGTGEGDLDSHDWDELSESDKGKYLEELKGVLQRSIAKTGLNKTSDIGRTVDNLLQEIQTELTKFNEKAILKMAHKKTFCSSDRTSTWKKRNKRYGFQAPGTKIGNLPKLNIYQDTSGSRSHTELNMDRLIIEKFLRAGAKECNLILWHSKIYKKKKYKLFQKVLAGEIESGGTVLNDVIDDINKTAPDLSLIITDGEYHLDANKTPNYQTIFLIVDNGRTDHQLKNVCKTVEIKNLKS